MKPRPLRILLVEDDEIDAELFLRCFQKNSSILQVTVVQDAVAALRVQRGGLNRSPLPGPYIILLNLNLPGMNGFEFLQELRSDPRLQATIVFVLGGEISDADRQRAYNYGVVGIVRKPEFEPDCIPLIRLLEAYQELVEFPILS